MAKSDSKKRVVLMAKEWKKSRSSTRSLNDLVGMGLLHSQELGGWRAPEGESFPDPRAGEIVVFEDFFKRGFGIPVYPFLQGLLLYYEIRICNLHPNSILLISTFIHLCEAYVGIEPHFDLFRYLFYLRKKGAVGGSKIAGGVYLNLRDGMKNRYLNCPWNISLTEWYKKWFYVREEPGSSTFCDVGYIPEKRVSWMDRPAFVGQVEDLMKLIDWSRLDGPVVVGNFICRRVMPCQKRVHHSAYEYAGSQDPTRMSPEVLEKAEVQQLLNELFNFADDNFVQSGGRMQAFKLGRPAPKVMLLTDFSSLILVLLVVDLSLILLQIGDVERCSVYISLAPSMENPAKVDPPEDDAARCPQYTSSEEEQNRPAPTTEDRAAGKRPLVEDPSPAETLPVESSQVPKRRRLVRITDDDDDEELAAPSLVWKPRSRPDVAPATTGQMTRDPPTSHIEPARVVETMAQASTGRTRRRFFTATHRLRPVSFQSYSRTAIYFAICCCL